MQPYVFDAVLDPSDSNEILWANHIQPLVENSFGGLDVTLLAYGQTGSGKTYTMCEKAHSMVAKTMERVFERMECPETLPKSCDPPRATQTKRADGLVPRPETTSSESDEQVCSQGTLCCVKVSVFEVYRNKPYTLVGKREQVEFRAEKDQSGLDQYTPYYHNRNSDRLDGVIVKSKEDCMRVFEDAMKRRSRRNMTLHGAYLNAESSRSHMVCKLHLQMITRGNGRIESCIQLVDLAGSEKIVTTVSDPNKEQETKEAQEEGKAIMTSLFNLLNLLKHLRAEASIEKSTWTSSVINTALHLGLSRPSPLIAFMACMRTEVPGNLKMSAAEKQKEEKDFMEEVRRTCKQGSGFIVQDGVARPQSRATSVAGRRSQMSDRQAD